MAAVLIALAVAALAYLAAAWLRRAPGDDLVLAFLRLTNEIFMRTWHGLRRTPRPPAEPLPPVGPAIVVSNHKSAADPLAIYASTRRPVRFLMAREYYEAPVLGLLCRKVRAIPVNRNGNDLGATKAALGALGEGDVIGIFPQGGIRPGVREIDPAGAKRGAALLALRSGAPVVPVHIGGGPGNPSVFRGVALPSRTEVRFGEPIRLCPSGRKPTREEVQAAARTIFEAIAALEGSP